MKNFDNILRCALLIVLAAGLIVATWHLSWLHKEDPRYEMITPTGIVRVLDRQQGTFYEFTYDGTPSVEQPNPPRSWKRLPPVPK